MRINQLFTKINACQSCGVTYVEPRKTDAAYQWRQYCPDHRRDFVELDQRKSRVLSWAESNWQRLEEDMKKEEAAHYAAYSQRANAAMNDALNAANAAAQSNAYGWGFGPQQNLRNLGRCRGGA